MVVDVDRVHKFPQNRLHRRRFPLAQGKAEIETKGCDPLWVGLVRLLPIEVGNFVPAGLQLSESAGELFKPRPALGRRHGPVLEGGQISVNCRFGLLQFRFDLVELFLALVADLLGALDASRECSLDEVKIREDRADGIDDRLLKLTSRETVGGAAGGPVLLAGMAHVVLIPGIAAVC